MAYKQMGDKWLLSFEKRQEMFSHWCDQQSVNYVVKQAGVSQRAANRYRQIDKWDKRLKKVQDNAAFVTEARTTQRLVDNLTLIKDAKNKIAKALKTGKIRGYVSDLPHLIKTEELLLGNPDSRPDEIKPRTKTLTEAEIDLGELAAILGYELVRNHQKPPGRISPAVAGNPSSSDDKK